MNVPAIRAALERLDANGCHWKHPLERAIVTVGLRACDEWEKRPHTLDRMVWTARVAVIADILREAGVEVGE